jgi:predicted dehydrogenase
MTKRAQLCLIGFGYWGPKLARAISLSHNAELFCIVEPNRLVHKEIRGSYPEVEIYESLDQIRIFDQISGVVIATPPATHVALASKCLEFGMSVLVEKPLAMTAKDAIEIKMMAEKRGLIAMPAHTFLFNPAIIWAKQFIDSGNVGEILYVYSQRLNLGQIRHDVDVLWSLAPHDISIFDYIIGERADSVSATGSSKLQNGLNDVAFLSVNYPQNIKAHAHVSWLDPSKTRKVTIVGTQKMIEIDDTSINAPVRVFNKSAYLVEDTSASFASFKYQVHSGEVIAPSIVQKEPLLCEIEDFASAINSKSIPKTNMDDAISVAAVLNAASSSIRDSGLDTRVEYEN